MPRNRRSHEFKDIKAPVDTKEQQLMAARAAPLPREARPLPQLPLRPRVTDWEAGGLHAGDGVGATGQEPKGQV